MNARQKIGTCRYGVYGVLQYFSYIVVVSFISGGNLSTRIWIPISISHGLFVQGDPKKKKPTKFLIKLLILILFP
jgi:hypothetical protein